LKAVKQANVHIGARIPASLADGLARRAVEEDRSVSAELRRALWRHVNDDGTLAGAPIVPTAAVQEPQDVKD